MRADKSIRDEEKDLYTSRFEKVKLPMITEFEVFSRYFDGEYIRCVRTCSGNEYMCITDLRNLTEYNTHDNSAKAGAEYLVKGFRTLRFLKTTSLTDPKIFARPSESFKRLVKWYKVGFKGKQPTKPRLRTLEKYKKEVPVVDVDTFLKKLIEMLNCFERRDIVRSTFICSMKQEYINFKKIVEEAKNGIKNNGKGTK